MDTMLVQSVKLVNNNERDFRQTTNNLKSKYIRIQKNHPDHAYKFHGYGKAAALIVIKRNCALVNGLGSGKSVQ